MNINRDNYEEIFMLYADNELTAEDRKAVEDFVAENTDLAEELNLLKQLQVKPDTDLVFDNKESLFRTEQEHAVININNYEEFFVLYADNELTNEQQASVEKFVYKNPSVQSDFELIQMSKLEADTSIVYEGKEDLYRHEKDEKVVPFFISIRAWKWAAAAILILLAGFIWMNQGSTKKLPEATARIDDKTEVKPLPQANKNETVKEEQLATTETKKAVKDSDENSRDVTKVVRVSGVKKKKENLKEETQVNDAVEINAKLEEQKDMVAQLHLRSAKISPVISTDENLNTTKNITSNIQHKDPIIDQPVYINTDKEDHDIRYANLNEQKNDDVVYVSNTTVRKQNPLRGIFRKASRFVERTANAKPSDGSGILIGNISIALR